MAPQTSPLVLEQPATSLWSGVLQWLHGIAMRLAPAGRHVSAQQLRLFFARRPRRAAPVDLRRVRVVEYAHVPAMAPAGRLMRNMLAMWIVSFIAHVALLVALTINLLPQPHTAEVVEWTVRPAISEAVDFEASQPLPTLTMANRSAPIQVQHTIGIPGMAAPIMSTAMDLRPDAERFAGAVNDVKSLLADGQGSAPVDAPGDGEGATQEESGNESEDEGESAGAQFFGVQAQGNRFVFVVDCSLSMVGDKWATACRELSDSIDRLSPQQHFYVVFFDGKSHRMFNDRRFEKGMLPATEANISRLRNWLTTVRLGYNTSPCLSVMFALTLQPDAIFLLSDGEFSDPTAAKLRKNNRVSDKGESKPRVAVHTIGFRSLDGKKMLTRIANENGGTYRYVP